MQPPDELRDPGEQSLQRPARIRGYPVRPEKARGKEGMNYGLIRIQLLNQAGARLPQILPDLFGKLLEVRLADV
jgi:hypothetical protein